MLATPLRFRIRPPDSIERVVSFKRPGETTMCVGFFLACVVVNLSFSAVGLHNSLFEVHEFRQFQTALTTRYILQDGFHLAYPTPLFGPPWSVPMEFPFYQWVVAAFHALTGLRLETSGRLVSLGFLYAALPAFLGLAGFAGLNRARRWLFAALILITPGYLYYSRCFLIESAALCVSAWFLLCFCHALKQRRAFWIAAAVVVGSLAALVKVTTCAVFLVVAAAFTLHLLWRNWRGGKDREACLMTATLALAIAGIVIAAGAAWTAYADAVKSGNPLAAELISSKLHTFNFGTWSQRLRGDFWDRMRLHTNQVVLAPINVAFVVAFALLLGRSYRKVAGVLLLGFASGPAIFANLYFVHDYYTYATGVFLLGVLALAWSQLLDLENFSVSAKWLVIALSAGLQIWSYTNGYLRNQLYNQSEAPELASLLSNATNPGDVLLVFGRDWDATIPYFAHRRAIMVTDHAALTMPSVHAVLDRLKSDQVGALVVTGELRKYPYLFKPFTDRLALSEHPVFASEDTNVYLRKHELTSTVARADLHPLDEYHLAEGSSTETVSSIMRRRTPGSAIDPHIITMLSPRPALVVHPFGLSGAEQNGRPVLNAHAPTDAIFNLPPHATEVHAEFGMDPGCAAPDKRTFGVEFRVELVTPDGTHRTLHSTFLQPTDHVADRGEKTIDLTLPKSTTGQLWFRTLPGPSGSIAFAWAYWARIEIK